MVHEFWSVFQRHLWRPQKQAIPQCWQSSKWGRRTVWLSRKRKVYGHCKQGLVTSEDREVLQRYLDRIESWAINNHWSLRWEIDNFCAWEGWFWLNIQNGKERQESSPADEIWGFGLVIFSAVSDYSQLLAACCTVSQKMSVWLKSLSKIMPYENDASYSSSSTTSPRLNGL